MKNVIITILAILVLGLGGYLVYDKVIDKDVKEEIKEEVVETTEEKEEYTLIDKENESIQFLYSYRALNLYGIDKKLYTTEYLKVEDRTLEEKYSIASNIFAKEKHKRYDAKNDQAIDLLDNKKVKNAYERIFGHNTYKKPKKLNFDCQDYEIYSEDENYYVLIADGCGGPAPHIVENIDEVRKYNDKIEVKTSFCVLGVSEALEKEDALNYYYYKDLDEKELIAKVAKNDNVNIFEEYKDKMNHMTYTYNLGEDGFYYYYSSQLDK